VPFDNLPRFVENRFDVLGPFGLTGLPDDKLPTIDLSSRPRLVSFKSLAQQPKDWNSEKHTCECRCSPPAKITLPPETRKLAQIPDKATRFVWVYPVATTVDLDDQTKVDLAQRGELHSLLLFGGFVYLAQDDNVVAVNAVRSVSAASHHHMAFLAPQHVSDTAVPDVDWEVVTVLALREHVTDFCWLAPGTRVFDEGERAVEFTVEHGAFVYRKLLGTGLVVFAVDGGGGCNSNGLAAAASAIATHESAHKRDGWLTLKDSFNQPEHTAGWKVLIGGDLDSDGATIKSSRQANNVMIQACRAPQEPLTWTARGAFCDDMHTSGL
jgi:hypothetical protein